VTSRIAVLASGGGTNLQAIFDHLDQLGARRSGSIELVASDRPQAGALARARVRGLPAVEIASAARPDAPTLAAVLADHDIDLVVLAGYLRLVPPEVVRDFEGRMLNVHPALLPAFGGPGMYGMRVHRAVLASGAKVSGITIHFVDEQFDRGAIVAQWPVPIRTDDDANRLAERVLRVEHLLYPRVVDAVASGRITLAQVRRGRAFTAGDDRMFSLEEREDTCLADAIDRALA
jgi:phosphoribosylglycinamide formyltransferase 1